VEEKNMEHEITAKGPLLDSQGRLREPGWAKTLILDYDRAAIKARNSRIKEWDYYCILAGDCVLALTIADNAYMGLLSASVLDLSAGTDATESVMTLMPMGKFGLPRNSAEGVTEAAAGGTKLRFEAKDGVRRLQFSWPTFCSKKAPRQARTSCCVPLPPDDAAAAKSGNASMVGLSGELVLTEKPARESMVIATPWSGAPHAFYYNQKINCQDVEGSFKFGNREFVLEKGKAFAVLDWGRGVWTWKNTWLWGSASGLAHFEGSKTPLSFGFNIGYGFGDTGAASENMVFVDGKAHKIGKLTIELDDRDFMKPWHAKSEDGRFDLVLTPTLDRAATSDFLILASIQHQVFGHWAGTVVLEDGKKIAVEGLLGFCEKVKNRW